MPLHLLNFKTDTNLLAHDLEQTMKTYPYVTNDMLKDATNLINKIKKIVFDEFLTNQFLTKKITPRNLGVITLFKLMPIIHYIVPHHLTTLSKCNCSIYTVWYAS